MSGRVLIADDDASIRLVLSQALTRQGYAVRATGAAATLAKWIGEGEGDIVITDVIMPDENIFQLLPDFRRRRPNLPIIVMSAQNTVMTAVNAAEHGVFDYLAKPFDLDEVMAVVRRALATPVPPSRPPVKTGGGRDERHPLIGRSAPMQEIYRRLARLVNSDLTVLIQGESGTGKSLTARALHDLGSRREGRLVTVNLGAAPRERIDIELFGVSPDRPGKLADADGGTLLLEEISDLPLDSQVRLLAVFDGIEPAINPRTGRRSDVRVIAATNRDLRALVGQGLFREDLYFRLNVATLSLPPLRARRDDIAELARAFLRRASREGLSVKSLDEAALAHLVAHDWPGNVRELENLIRRICALYADKTITAEIVCRELTASAGLAGAAAVSLADLVEANLVRLFASAGDDLPAPGLYDRVLEEIERPLFRQALASTGGNQVRAAELLGINRNTLRKRLVELGVEPKRGK